MRGEKGVVATKEWAVMEEFIAVEDERGVVGGDGGVLEAEVGVVDEKEAAGFEFGVKAGDLALELCEGEAAVGGGGGVVAILAALEDGHREDGVEVGERGEVGAAGGEETDAGAAVGFAGLAEAPAVHLPSLSPV